MLRVRFGKDVYIACQSTASRGSEGRGEGEDFRQGKD
jgi:hypothetical protein